MKFIFLVTILFITGTVRCQQDSAALRKESKRSVVGYKSQKEIARAYVEAKYGKALVKRHFVLSEIQPGDSKAVLFNIKNRPSKQGRNMMGVYFTRTRMSGWLVIDSTPDFSKHDIKRCLANSKQCKLWLDKTAAIAIAREQVDTIQPIIRTEPSLHINSTGNKKGIPRWSIFMYTNSRFVPVVEVDAITGQTRKMFYDTVGIE